MAEIIDGKRVADEVVETVKQRTAALVAAGHAAPGLAVVIVGEDPASQVYVASKSKKAKECGFKSVQHSLPEDTTQGDLLALVARLNADPSIHGILVQLPLPKHLDSEPVVQSILPEKDVDGLHVINAGKLATGDLQTGLISCTPAGSMVLIERVRGKDLSGLNAVVIGRSNLFGKPMGQLLLAGNATVTMAHSRTGDLPAICRTADILVAAVGRRELVKADWVKPGAIVVDFGTTYTEDGLRGDCDQAGVAEVAGMLTPVPGGTGPVTNVMLMENLLSAAELLAAQ